MYTPFATARGQRGDTAHKHLVTPSLPPPFSLCQSAALLGASDTVTPHATRDRHARGMSCRAVLPELGFFHMNPRHK